MRKEDAATIRYATALFAAACDAGAEEIIADELSALIAIAKETEGFAAFWGDLSVNVQQKKALVQSVWQGKIHPYLLHYLFLLLTAGRGQLLFATPAVYHSLLLQKQGKKEALLETAVAVDEGEKAALSAALSHLIQGEVAFFEKIDPALLGGARITLGDTVIDGTLATRLKEMRRVFVK